MLQHEKFQSEPGSRVGTPAYLAPEVILTTRGKTYDGKVEFHVFIVAYSKIMNVLAGVTLVSPFLWHERSQ